MEVKINREIRNYAESMFFGLSMRQSVFALLAIAVAVGLYFILKPYVGTETVSWMCILGEPRQLKCVPTNIYYEALKGSIAAHEKEVLNAYG